MGAPIEDVTKLSGRKVSDQAQTELGQITDVYAMESGFPPFLKWVRDTTVVR